MMRRIVSRLFLLGLLVSVPFTASADIVWSWQFESEAGTFTTTGTLSDLSSPNTFIITAFTVSSSVIPGNIGATYFQIQPDQGILWNGVLITQFFRSSGAFTNGSNFHNSSDFMYGLTPPPEGALLFELPLTINSLISQGEATFIPISTISVPTLSQWAYLVLVILLFFIAVLQIRRRSLELR